MQIYINCFGTYCNSNMMPGTMSTVELFTNIAPIVYVAYRADYAKKQPNKLSKSKRNKIYTNTPFLDYRSYYEVREKIKRIRAKNKKPPTKAIIPHKILCGNSREPLFD